MKIHLKAKENNAIDSLWGDKRGIGRAGKIPPEKP